MIVVAGESLIDLIQHESRGETGPLYEACPGGSPFNCAVALGRLEVATGYLCPLSRDVFGTQLRQRLEDSDVTPLLSAAVAAPTSLAVVSLSPDGGPSYSFYRQGTAERQLESAALTAALPGDLTALQIGSLALTEKDDAPAWTAAIQTAVERGAVLSVDPNIRQHLVSDHDDYRRRLSAILQQADVMKASDEDLAYIYPGLAPEDAVQRALAETRLSLAVLTLGKDGAVAFTANGHRIALPAMALPSEGDMVGAGDSFQAGLLAWLQRTGHLTAAGLAELGEAELTEMLTFARCVAGLNCAETGCNPPRLEKVLETLSAS